MHMKRIKYLLVLVLGVIFLTGCKHDYKTISYSKFIEEFKNSNYYVNDYTSKYDDLFVRYIDISGKNIEFSYYEFETEEKAKEYIKESYKDSDVYSFEDQKDYIVISKNSDGYFYGVQAGKTFVSGQSNSLSFKRDVNKVMKALGY